MRQWPNQVEKKNLLFTLVILVCYAACVHQDEKVILEKATISPSSGADSVFLATAGSLAINSPGKALL